jgi:hypothetical protein
MTVAAAAQAQMTNGDMEHGAVDLGAIDDAGSETYAFCDLTIIGTVTPATLPNAPVAGGSESDQRR